MLFNSEVHCPKTHAEFANAIDNPRQCIYFQP